MHLLVTGSLLFNALVGGILLEPLTETVGSVVNGVLSSLTKPLFVQWQSNSSSSSKPVSTIPYRLEVKYKWKVLRFETPKAYTAIPSYKVEDTYLTGIEPAGDVLFLTAGRVTGGAPASLATVPKNSSRASPMLQAYPNWEWHKDAVAGKIKNCNKTIVSVYKAIKDKCNRLWVLDSGVHDLVNDPELVCPPKVLVFDLDTDKLIKLLVLPRNVWRPISMFASLAVDIQGDGSTSSCGNSYVYIADGGSPGLVVYDESSDKFWRHEHPYMHPDPNNGTIVVMDQNYTVMFGIVSLALGGSGSNRRLYFQSYSSDKMFYIPTSYLQQGHGTTQFFELPVSVAFIKPSQSMALTESATDGQLIFSPISQGSIVKWHPDQMTERRELVRNPELLQVVEDIRPDDVNPKILWLNSAREQKYFTETVNIDETNQRIMCLHIL